MQYITNTLEFKIEENTVISLGKFDGLHMGHQSLIAEISKYTQYQKVLFTFAFPEGPYILTPEEKYVKAEIVSKVVPDLEIGTNITFSSRPLLKCK